MSQPRSTTMLVLTLALGVAPVGCAADLPDDQNEDDDVVSTSENALNQYERAFLDRVTAPCFRSDFAYNDIASDLAPWYYVDYQYQYKVGNRTYRVYKVYDAWFAGGGVWLRANIYPYFGVAHPRDCTGK